jgi:hypothetical protein
MPGVPSCATSKPPPTSLSTLKDARRNARFTYAQRRIRKIVDGSPELTDEQLSKLAAIIQGGAGQ